MDEELLKKIVNTFTPEREKLLPQIVSLIVTIIISMIIVFFARRVINVIFGIIIKRNKNRWNYPLFESNLLPKITNLIVPAAIIINEPDFGRYNVFMEKGLIVVCMILIFVILDAALKATDKIYTQYEISKERPIKGYTQIVKILLIIITVLVSVGVFVNMSPWEIMSGIGAMTAIVILAFKDIISGFTSGIQLTANNMVRIGDWIEMPKYGADGDVIEINLTTIKVQNWDKTITTIPIYAFTSDSFKNYRGMEESGGRRIKRAVYIDTSTIKFCDEEMLKRYEKIEYISEYIVTKKKELDNYNQSMHVYLSELANGRRMTNIGTLRAYITAYLKSNTQINQEMMLLVRQMEATSSGLPIEIYCFSIKKDWISYESLQSDIFDHIISILPAFDLRMFQNPTGSDFRHFGH